jgi:hypothetical protein
MRHIGLRLGRTLRRFLVVLLLSWGPALALGGCSSPPVGSPFIPIPPPNPTIGPATPELDSAGVSHTYWKITSPAEPHFSNTWVYVDNDSLGVGVSLRTSADGSYATRIEGQEGDRILFGFGSSFAEADFDSRLCRPLREGLADTPCQ